ncbi:MAG: nucleotide exchange factor GrpE [Bacteroidia bacterium]
MSEQENKKEENQHEDLNYQADGQGQEEELKAMVDEILNNDQSKTDTETDPIEKMKAELTEVQDKYIRLYSEFENYKRRTTKERSDLLRSANQETLVSLLPVMDDFERAMKSINAVEGNDAMKTGIELVYGKLKTTLTQKGLKEMETNGKEFDVEFHEGITKIPAPTEDLKGKVIDTLEKGYFLNEKVIRFAKVVVGE